MKFRFFSSLKKYKKFRLSGIDTGVSGVDSYGISAAGYNLRYRVLLLSTATSNTRVQKTILL